MLYMLIVLFFASLKVKEQRFLNLYVIIYKTNVVPLLTKKYILVFLLFM